MSTYLSLLRIAFWMLPIQRFCTVLGFGVLVVLGGVLLSPMPLARTLMGYGYLIALAPSLLLGGAFWRALSAPRVASLAPRGRMRLFCAVLGLAATICLPWFVYDVVDSLVWSMGSWLAGVSIQRLASHAAELLTISLLQAAAWLITTFVASRSPLAMLLALLAWIVGANTVWRLDFMYPGLLESWRQLEQPWGLALSLAPWTLFGIWYLRTRRIRPPGWLLPGGQSVLGAVALADTTTGGLGKSAALERLALGGASVSRLLVQWSLVFGVLLLLLMVLAWLGNEKAQIVAHVAFAALILSPAIVAAQAVAIVRRARALWLPSGFTRDQLFAFTQRTLLKFALGMALLFAAFLLLLWFTQPWHPELGLAQALGVIVVPGVLVAACALFRPGGHAFYWPVVAQVLWFMAWRPLTSSSPVTWSSAGSLLWYPVAALAIVLLLALARRRWQVDDLPRAATSR